jgi:isoleucyl-tRNA synthetase
MAVHSAVKPALEQARGAGLVGSSLQSIVEIHIPKTADGTQQNGVLSVLEKHADELAAMFVVSGVHINKHQNTHTKLNEPLEDIAFRQDFEIQGVKGYVEVRLPEQAKCPRCWRYVAPQEDALCNRCEDVVKAL